MGNYLIIFFRLFVIFLIFSIFFKAILCACVPYVSHLLIYFTALFQPEYVLFPQGKRKQDHFFYFPLYLSWCLECHSTKILGQGSVQVQMHLDGDEGLWQRPARGLAGSSPVMGTGEEGGKLLQLTAACGMHCFLNRIRSLKIGCYCYC